MKKAGVRLILLCSVALTAWACEPTWQSDSKEVSTQMLVEQHIDSLIAVSDYWFSSPNFKDSLFDVNLLTAFAYAQDYEIHKKKAQIYRKVGKRYRNISEFGVALYFYQKSLEIATYIGDEALKAHLKGDMAVVFRRIDDNAKALNLHFQALEWAEAASDTFLILASNNGIGNVYISYKNFPKAIDYFHHSLNLIALGYPNKLSEAINTNNIGEAWLALGNSDSALYYVNKSYQLNLEMGSKLGQAICENGLGDIHLYQQKYAQAIANYKEALRLNREVGNTIYIAGNLLNLGKAYLIINNSRLSEEYLNAALSIFKEIGSKLKIVETLSELAHLYRQNGQNNKALHYMDEVIVYKDTITHEVSRLSSEGMNALYKTEKQEREIIILKQKDELSQLRLNRQKWFILGSLIMIIGGVVFSIYAIYQRRVTIRFTRQIQLQNNNIQDSIRYAQKIQSAMLPDIEQIKSRVGDAFILYKPRDIVSGDFYWFTVKDELSIVAVADCTGHGVPGALMSMLGIAFLNEIVSREGITQPHLILNRLREQVVYQLKQKGNLEDSKDGIDISIYAIDHKTMKLSFAGAYIPLYIIRDNKLIHLKADTMPIGYHPKKDYSFSVKTFDLQKGDTLYSSSDGYHDQFGGREGTKFMIKNMKELFLKVHKNPMAEQCNILKNTLADWQGKYEQLDDIIVLGIRI